MWRYCLPIIILNFCCYRCFSQLPENYHFYNLSIKDGLSSNTIYDIKIDHTGFIWLASDRGITRYDGAQFKNYRHVKGDSTSLVSDHIIKLIVDDKNMIWALSPDNGISCLNPVTQNFKNYSRKLGYSFVTDTIRDFFFAPDKKIWFGTWGKGVFSFDTLTKKSEHIFFERPDMSVSKSKSVCFDKLGRMWIATWEGLYVIDYATRKEIYKQKVKCNSKPEDSLSCGNIHTLVYDGDRYVYAGTYRGLNRIDIHNFRIKNYFKWGNYTNESNVRKVYISDNKTIWVTFRTINGLWYKDDNDSVRKICGSVFNPLSLQDCTINCMMEEPDGSLWVGTNSGLYIAHPKTDAVTLIRSMKQLDKRLPDLAIMYYNDLSKTCKIYVSPDGITYVTDKENVHKFDFNCLYPPDKEFYLVDLDSTHVLFNSGIRNNDIHLFDKEILKSRSSSGAFKKLTIDEKFEIISTLHLSDSILFFTNNDAWYSYYKKLKKFSNNMLYKFFPKISRELRFYKSLVDPVNPSYIWINDDHYLIKYHLTNYSQEIWNLGVSEYADNNDIFYFRNNIWLSARNSICRYDFNKQSVVEKYGPEAGLMGSLESVPVTDKFGNLWFLTSIGLARFKAESNRFDNFTKDDGILLNGSQLTYLDKENTLVINSPKGVILVDINKINTSIAVHTPVISEIKTFNQEYLTDSAIYLKKHFIFSPGQTSLTFRIAPLSYFPNGRLQYKYTLDDFDNEWKIQNSSEISYTNLPPGNYTLKVAVRHINEEWPESYSVFYITVKPWFWQTSAFKILLTISLFLLVLAIIKIRTSNLRKQNELLEKKVQSRTSQLKIEKERSDELLMNILPEKIAEELKQNGSTDARLFESVTIMFTDFKEFTKLAEIMNPKDLVNEIDYCFRKYDEIITSYGIEKIKTIGDSYMAVAGLPKPSGNHAELMVRAALDIRDFMIQYKEQRIEANKPYFEVRIGIHSGEVVAGIVGVKKFAYDVWGDAVNTASRLESKSTPGKINISEFTKELLGDAFEIEYRGEIEAKNKGILKMYYVERLKV